MALGFCIKFYCAKDHNRCIAVVDKKRLTFTLQGNCKFFLFSSFFSRRAWNSLYQANWHKIQLKCACYTITGRNVHTSHLFRYIIIPSRLSLSSFFQSQTLLPGDFYANNNDEVDRKTPAAQHFFISNNARVFYTLFTFISSLSLSRALLPLHNARDLDHFAVRSPQDVWRSFKIPPYLLQCCGMGWWGVQTSSSV